MFATKTLRSKLLTLLLAMVLPLLALVGATPAVAAVLPVVTGLSPAVGKTSGGVVVTITGTGLTGASKVLFGTKAGTKLKVTSDTQLQVTAPSGAGTVDVKVTTPTGSSGTAETARFRYMAAPLVSKVSPTTGSTNGGTKVTLTGGNFVNVTKVTFGSSAAKDLTVTSEKSLTVTAPKHATGRVDVRVYTAFGTSPTTSKDRYTYLAPPSISKASPSKGKLAAGTKVTISGSRFTKITKVMFGDVAGTALKMYSSSKLTVSAPAHAAGTVAVAVTGTYGTSPANSTARYTYIAPPAITQLSPTTGTVKGGTKITLTGSNFTDVTKVIFGTKAGTKRAVKSATSLTVTSPGQTSRTIDVTVTTKYGTSPTSTNTRYTYGTPTPTTPTISTIAPISGTTAGGTKVTITGTNLTGTTKVTLDGTPATNVTVVSATQVAAITPAHAAGDVDVVLTAPGGTVTKTSAFQYTAPTPAAPTITTVAPATGPTTGGTTVTITGTNLFGTTKVTLAGTAATSMTVVSATQITATTPAHTAGTVDLTLTTPAGTVTKAAAYTYTQSSPTDCHAVTVHVRESIASDTTWTKCTTYIVDSGVEVPPGVVLSIVGGTVVKGQLRVSGTLAAKGTSIDPVIFSSVGDDSIGASAGSSDAALDQPFAFQVDENSTISLTHVQVVHSLSLFQSGSASTGASVTIQDSVLHTSVALSRTSRPVLLRNEITSPTQVSLGGLYLSHVDDVTGIPFKGPDVNTFRGDAMARSVTFWDAGVPSETTVALSTDGNVSAYISPMSSYQLVAFGRLVIEPGVIVKGPILVYGSLSAAGTIDKPVIFTSQRDDTAGGDTDGDNGTGSQSFAVEAQRMSAIDLSHVLIDKTLSAIYCSTTWGSEGKSLRIADSIINASLAITLFPKPVLVRNHITAPQGQGLNLSHVDDVTGIPFKGPDVNTFHGDAMARSVTFWDAGVPSETTVALSTDGNVSAYISPMSSYQLVAFGRLVIEPGVIVKGPILVYGSLSAAGTIDKPVIFTSQRDDTAGGDTNGDGAETIPSKSDDELVRMGSGAHYVIDYALFMWSRSAVHVGEFTSVAVSNSKFINTVNAFEVASAGSIDRGTNYFYNNLPCAPPYDSQVSVNNTWFGSSSWPGIAGDVADILDVAVDLSSSGDTAFMYSQMTNQLEMPTGLGGNTRPWALWKCQISGVGVIIPVTPVAINNPPATEWLPERREHQ